MNLGNKKYCIFGIGGSGRETLSCLIDSYSSKDFDVENNTVFMVSERYYKNSTLMGIPVIKQSEFCSKKYKVVVAIGDPIKRMDVVNQLPKETTYTTIIHPTAVISKWVNIGAGSIITAGCIITCNIIIGKHVHLNLQTTIGHDCILGDFVTTAQGVSISGNCTFGQGTYLGANASVKEKTTLGDNVTIGMGGAVTKSILIPGVYVGVPVKKVG